MASTINGFELLPYQRKQIKTIMTHINGRRHLHIHGSEGTGKSVLLDYLYNNWKEFDNGLIPIYCRSGRTLREILLRATGFLLDHFKHLKSIDKFKQVKEIRYHDDIEKLNIRIFCNLVYSYIPQDNFCIILDHLECVTPRIHALLRVLYEQAIVITASRQIWEVEDYSFRGKLDYCLYPVPKLRIENLQRRDAMIFMKNLYDKLNINVHDKPQMFADVFRVTKGNPKSIKQIFEKAQKPEYLKGDILNLNLILIDCKIEKIKIR